MTVAQILRVIQVSDLSNRIWHVRYIKYTFLTATKTTVVIRHDWHRDRMCHGNRTVEDAAKERDDQVQSAASTRKDKLLSWQIFSIRFYRYRNFYVYTLYLRFSVSTTKIIFSRNVFLFLLWCSTKHLLLLFEKLRNSM